MLIKLSAICINFNLFWTVNYQKKTFVIHLKSVIFVVNEIKFNEKVSLVIRLNA